MLMLIESIFVLQKNVTDYVHKTFHYFIDDGIEMLSYEGCQIIYAFW